MYTTYALKCSFGKWLCFPLHFSKLGIGQIRMGLGPWASLSRLIFRGIAVFYSLRSTKALRSLKRRRGIYSSYPRFYAWFFLFIMLEADW